MKTFEDMVEFAKKKSGQLIDSRKPENYLGKAEEPTNGKDDL